MVEASQRASVWKQHGGSFHTPQPVSRQTLVVSEGNSMLEHEPVAENENIQQRRMDALTQLMNRMQWMSASDSASVRSLLRAYGIKPLRMVCPDGKVRWVDVAHCRTGGRA